ncbi:MAG TPA: methylmalonyl-CoA epimerase [Myxococcales bacterium]|jgi:methylmalonyl-CoA mutase C-terminal domain/subunit
MTSVRKIRVLVAKPGLDGHDRGARVVASALRDAGFEVVYSGLRASVEAIVAAAIQEDVDVIGLSVLSGAHESICKRLLAGLREHGMEVPVVVGGIVPERDAAALRQLGVSAVFGPETPLPKIVEEIRMLAEGRAAEVEATFVPHKPPERPRVLGLAHVAVCVEDLDEASRTFERILGQAPVRREFVPEQRTEAVFFDLGGASLELVTPRGGNEGLEKFLKKRGPGLHHIALKVEGLDEGLKALRGEGVQAIDEEPRPGARGHSVAFLHPKAAGGVLVELVEETDSDSARPTHQARGGQRGEQHEAIGAGGDPGGR